MKSLGNVTLGLVNLVAQRWHHRPRFLPYCCSALLSTSGLFPVWLQNGPHCFHCNFEIWQCPKEEEKISFHVSLFKKEETPSEFPSCLIGQNPLHCCTSSHSLVRGMGCWEGRGHSRFYPELEISHFPWEEENHQDQTSVSKKEGEEQMWVINE